MSVYSYNEGVHSMGSHIVYSSWYIKSHVLADIKRRKSQINKLKYIFNILHTVLYILTY